LEPENQIIFENTRKIFRCLFYKNRKIKLKLDKKEQIFTLLSATCLSEIETSFDHLQDTFLRLPSSWTHSIDRHLREQKRPTFR